MTVFTLVLLLLPSALPFQQSRRNWADQAEYDLVAAFTRARDPQIQLDILLEWEDRYPASEFAPERMQYMLMTYSALVKLGGAYEPRHIKFLYRIAVRAPALVSPTKEQIKLIHDAANRLLAQLKKPDVAAMLPPDAQATAERALTLKVPDEPKKE